MRRALLLSILAVAASWVSIGHPRAADPASGFQFQEQLVGEGYSYCFGIEVGDVDGDGDLDITAADALPNNSLYWYENDGHGSFRKHVVQKDDPQRLERHALADIDQDGHLDIVIVKNLFGDVLWFRNDGMPRNGKLWQRHLIADKKLVGAYDVAVADLDGDGDLDVAASSWRLSNNFVWFENNSRPADGEWKMHMIDENVKETRMIRAADIDNDGDPDLVCTAREEPLVAWYENPGDPASRPWKKHIIDATSPQPIHGELVDMDKDGDWDLVLCLGMGYSGDLKLEQLAWYENPGRSEARQWKKHVIQSGLVGAFEAATADFDRDGDLDVVVTTGYADLRKLGARQQSGVWLFENPGTPVGKWRAQLLRDNWQRANQVHTADIDGDGWIDIVAAAERGSNEVRWWRNLGGSK